VASAVPDNLAVVEGLYGTVVAVSRGESLIFGEKILDGGKLLLGNTKRVLHDEVLHGLAAGRSGQTALVREVLASKRLLKFVQVNGASDLGRGASSGGSIVPVDVV